jgi:hypothetical protein
MLFLAAAITGFLGAAGWSAASVAQSIGLLRHDLDDHKATTGANIAELKTDVKYTKQATDRIEATQLRIEAALGRRR